MAPWPGGGHVLGDARLALPALMLCSGPTLISELSLVAQRPARRHSRDMAWLTSATSVGTAAGPAAAGEVIDAVGDR